MKKQPTMVAEDCCYIKEALKFAIPPARMAEEAVSPVGFAMVLVFPTVLPKQVMHRWLSIDCCPWVSSTHIEALLKWYMHIWQWCLCPAQTYPWLCFVIVEGPCQRKLQVALGTVIVHAGHKWPLESLLQWWPTDLHQTQAFPLAPTHYTRVVWDLSHREKSKICGMSGDQSHGVLE